jgi:hypothetical protein
MLGRARKQVKRETNQLPEKSDGTLYSWIDIPRNYILEAMSRYVCKEEKDGFKNLLRLTDDYEKVETPVGFKVTLLPHQKVIIKAMYDLEQKRYVRVNGLRKNQSDVPDDGIIETCAGVLSDKLGSGKTYDILGLIALSNEKKIPKTANISHLPVMRRDRAVKMLQRNAFDLSYYEHIGCKTEVRRIYKKYLPLTLIFVSKSVLLQWQKAITENTNLKVFMIENIFNLKVFYEMLFKPNKHNNRDKLMSYDIILVKNGDISGRFEPEELKETQLQGVGVKKILSVFGELFKDFCFERIVLDDFDTLGIPNNAFTIPALFTWFVSATKKATTSNNKEYDSKTITDAICNYRPAYTSVWKNRNLFTFFNISCDEKFVDDSTQSSQVEFYSYQFHNPNEQYIGLLGAMGTQDAHMIMEALNGDAINTAAGNVGIKTTSVADIFEKVLDNKWNIYKKNLEVEKYMFRVDEYLSELGPRVDDEGYGNAVLEKFRRNLRKPGPMELVRSSIKYEDAGVTGIYEEVKSENTASKEENGKAINRVKDNLKQGDCPITCVPLAECNGVVIMKCCGVTISAEAASWSLKFHRGGSGGGSNIAGVCPNCRRQIEFTQLILVDKELKLEDIINESIEIPEPLPVEIKEDEEIVETEELNKFSCITRIILGEDLTDPEIAKIKQQRVIKIPGMLVGNFDKGSAPVSDRKVLVYASYGETLDLLTEKLIAKGISFLRVQGTTRHIEDMVNRYNLPNSNPESISVLLINGAQYCAGLNLQVTTDLIYTHKIVDQNVESQVAGRASRYGRVHNLRIHYVLYDNEINFMFNIR